MRTLALNRDRSDLPEYTLTITSAHGTVAKDPDQETYHKGDTVQLTATAADYYNFSAWSGDITSSDNPTNVTITGDMTVTAGYDYMYLLWDQFTTPDAAPVNTPRTCEPGPGTTVYNAANTMYITGGLLVIDPALDWTTNYWYEVPAGGGTFTSALGLAYGSIIKRQDRSCITQFGWDTATEAFTGGGAALKTGIRVSWESNPSIFLVVSDNPSIVNDIPAINESVKGVSILGGKRQFVMYHDNVQWILGFVTKHASLDTAATVYAGGTNYSGALARLTYLDNKFVGILGGAWTIEYGIATQRVVTPALSSTYTHTANAIIEFVVGTLPTGTSIRVSFRKQDATNYLYCEVSPAGNQVFGQVVAGVDTPVETDAAVIVAGETIHIICDETRIWICRRYIGADTYVRGIVQTNANFTAATGGAIESLGTGGVVTDLISWPRYPVAAITDGLDDFFPSA